ncbi:MAG: M20/M25/M40 family metallo-hydrolase, partial [Bacteroidia bacterium]|nr:M20/M25/M40 family metallo-hydrolase [Bacteroidia bacterium]
GISAHPGYAKGKMVSAIKIASHFMNSLPKDAWCPEATSGMEGFVHAVHFEPAVEKATIQFIVRDFDTKKLSQHESDLETYAQKTIEAFPGAKYTAIFKEQYRNMKEILDQNPHVMENARKAYIKAGLNPVIESIRGGTDGSRLSFMGLPCPNIFTGEMAIHSRREYVSVQDMEKAVEVILHIAQV